MNHPAKKRAIEKKLETNWSYHHIARSLKVSVQYVAATAKLLRAEGLTKVPPYRCKGCTNKVVYKPCKICEIRSWMATQKVPAWVGEAALEMEVVT